MMPSASEVAAFRCKLAAAGYCPIPLYGKTPPVYGKNNPHKGLGGWQNLTAVTDEMIAVWAKTWPDAVNTGVLTRNLPTLDLDILNEEAVHACEDLVRERCEEAGYVLVRIGLPPKRAIPFRTEEPFDKIVVNVIAPNGGEGQKIEFLGNGQQVVVAGVHPDTKQPYRWHGGEPGKIAREELPYTREAEARALVDDVVKLLVRDFGYDVAGKKPGAGGGPGHVDMDDLMRQFFSGASMHPAALSMIGSWAHQGIPKDSVLAFLEAIFIAAKVVRYAGRWDELVKMVEDIYAKEQAKTHPVDFEDFYACSPEAKFIFTPTGALWPAAAVNTRLPWIGGVKPSTHLFRNRPVDQMTWAPGEPSLIKGKLIVNGGWIERPTGQVYNLYRPPRPHLGRRDLAQPWIDHLYTIYPTEARHIELWLACRCQRPHVKINHALVLGGAQGIGKDTLLEGPRHAVGYWNCATVSPIQLLGRFNSFLQSVLLIVSEARDLGEINRPNFYEHTKAIIAAPPDVLYIDEKNTHPYYIPNLTGVIITTNHKTAGIYLPSDDRRHYMTWSPLESGSFDAEYWTHIWGFYFNGGFAHVAAYLQTLDLSDFDPYEPPPHTDAFHEIVVTGAANEVGEFADALRMLGYPDVTTLEQLSGTTSDPDFADWIKDRKNRRMLPRWMEASGYVIVPNPDSKQGLWSVSGKQQIIYGKASLTGQQRYEAARRLARS